MITIHSILGPSQVLFWITLQKLKSGNPELLSYPPSPLLCHKKFLSICTAIIYRICITLGLLELENELLSCISQLNNLVWVIFICTCGVQNHTDGQLIGAYDHIEDCDLDDRIIYILGKKTSHTWITLVLINFVWAMLSTWFLSSMKFPLSC